MEHDTLLSPLRPPLAMPHSLARERMKDNTPLSPLRLLLAANKPCETASVKDKALLSPLSLVPSLFVSLLLFLVCLAPSWVEARTWDFSKGPDGFPVKSEKNRWKTGITNGAYFIRACKPGLHVQMSPNFKIAGDFAIEVDVRYANACWFDGYGVLFGPQPNFTNAYQFGWIQGDLGCQRYQAFKKGDGGEKNRKASTQLFPDWFFPLYHFKDGKKWNHWKIERRGRRISFYLNGHLRYHLTDDQRWPEVYIGLYASTFENSCDGPHNKTACVKGSESHFDNLKVYSLSGGNASCQRHSDCAQDRYCELASHSCKQATSCQTSGDCAAHQVCVRQSCHPQKQGQLNLSLTPAQPRAGQHLTFVLPQAYANNQHLLTIRDPQGAWVTPTPLGPHANGKKFGLTHLQQGAYLFALYKNMISEHRSDCGKQRNNKSLTEALPLAQVYLTVY